MESDLRKRIFLILGTIAILSAILFFLPFIEEFLRDTVYTQLNLMINEKDEVMSIDGTKPSPTSQVILALIANLFRIVKIILAMAIVISIVRLFTNLIFGTALKKTNQDEIASLLKTVISVIIYIVAFFIIFKTQYKEIDITALFTGSTIIGIVVGLALQDTLGNLFSGIAQQADQSYQVGDVISISNRGIGVVESVSWRGVKIRTFQNKLLVISNSVLGKETIEVAPRDNLNARIVKFNTLYTNSPTKVIQVVREAVRQVENVSPKRRPIVRIWNLGDNGLDWEVKYWITNYAKHNDTDALIRQRIWYAFKREGLDFAYPTRTVYMTEQTDKKETSMELADEICERINNVSIFSPLSDEETNEIAQNCAIRVFAPQEPIIQTGQTEKSMFIIHRGIVNVQVVENEIAKKISTLRAGDFFGEMSLFTGEPRTADVVAETEAKVLEIKPDVLKPILEKNPELVRIIGEIIEERRELLEQHDEEKKAKTEAENKGVFINIRKFFGLDK